MSIKLRLALLLGLLLLAFSVSLLVLRRFEWLQAEQVLANSRQGRIDLLERWLTLTGESLRQYADDYSRWDQLVAYVARPDPKWAQANIDANLASFNAQAVWVLRPDGSVIHAYNHLQEAALAPPLPASDFRTLAADTPFMHFFASTAEGVIEVRGAPIKSPADDAATAAVRGWFLAGRLWNRPVLTTLEHLTEGHVTLVRPGRAARPATAGEDAGIHVFRPLTDWRGRTVRLLEFTYQPPEIGQLLQANAFDARVFAVFGLVVICALALGLQQWVLRPLGWISDSLARSDITPIRPLLKEKTRTELGRVALLTESAFTQRAQLEREVEERKRAEAALRESETALRRTLDERARLGRDLHDGVIQSLYAAGMGLAGIRAQIRHDPAEAEARIDQTRAALNETIRDVRNFIVGLEPEAVKLQPFAHAVGRLIEFLSSVKPLQATIDIDEPLAASLTLEQRAHSLQIAREAVSNAVRHGQAGHIRVALLARDGHVEFSVTDDGRGFDPAAPKGPGHGLNNLAERAHELGAELTVTSKPGKGTVVILVFPRPASP